MCLWFRALCISISIAICVGEVGSMERGEGRGWGGAAAACPYLIPLMGFGEHGLGDDLARVDQVSGEVD